MSVIYEVLKAEGKLSVYFFMWMIQKNVNLLQLYGALGWYRGELLTLAKDLATRLLPAFNTTTGIPHAKVS